MSHVWDKERTLSGQRTDSCTSVFTVALEIHSSTELGGHCHPSAEEGIRKRRQRAFTCSTESEMTFARSDWDAIREKSRVWRDTYEALSLICKIYVNMSGRKKGAEGRRRRILRRREGRMGEGRVGRTVQMAKGEGIWESLYWRLFLLQGGGFLSWF